MRIEKARGDQSSLDPLSTARSNELGVKVETAVKKHKCLQLVSIEMTARIPILDQKRSWEKGCKP